MAYVTLTSDLNGFLFSVDHDGQLRRQRLPLGPGDGAPPSGLGDVIGTGWGDVNRLAAVRTGGRLVLIGRTYDGGVVTAQVGEPAIATWSNARPAREPEAVAESWVGVTTMRTGGAGELLALGERATVWRIRLGQKAGADGVLVPGVPESVSGASEDRRSMFVLDDTLFEVAADGSLRVQAGTAEKWSGDGWTTLARDPGGTMGYFPSAPGVVSFVDSEGRLFGRTIVRDAAGVPKELGPPWNQGDRFGKWIFRACKVEGYCWPQSATTGEAVDFFIAGRVRPSPVAAPIPIDVDFVKLRVIEGNTHADAVMRDIPPRRLSAPAGVRPAGWERTGAGWSVLAQQSVPAEWRSGVYAMRCTDEHGQRYYIPFVVRPGAPSAPFAVLANTNTWNAYNIWGGTSKYIRDDRSLANMPLPFLRPNPGLAPDLPAPGWPVAGMGTPDGEWAAQVGHLLRAELWVTEWLESLGPDYAYDVYTDADLDAGRFPLVVDGRPAYRGLIISTHPEYWTTRMYRAVERFQACRGNVVYLGGNGLYELVKLDGPMMYAFPDGEPTPTPSGPGRRLMRDCGLPEHRILGVGFESGAELDGTPFAVARSGDGNPALRDVSARSFGAQSRRTGRMAHGWEIDRRDARQSPPEANADSALIAHAPNGPGTGGHMLCYRNAHGGLVFSASSLSFGGSLAVDPVAQRIVRNVLDECLR